jgi:hypothetical protein
MQVWIFRITSVLAGILLVSAAPAAAPATAPIAAQAGLRMVKVSVRSGGKERGLDGLRKRDTAIVFTTSNGQKIEVDLLETPDGKLLLRSHSGAIVLAPSKTIEKVTTRPSAP